MKPLTPEELQQILDTTGLSKNAVEKKFGMGQGSVGKFLKGSLKSLPDKYISKIRKLEKGVEPDTFVNPKEYAEERDLPTEIFDEVPGLIPEVKFMDERNISEYTAEEINQKLFTQTLSGEVSIAVPEKCHIEYKRPIINKDFLP